MNRTGRLLALLILLGGAGEARAQRVTLEEAQAGGLVPSPGILRNSIANLHAEGDTLWVGPHLNVTTDGGATWQVVDVDSLSGFRNRVYSLDVDGQVLWAGLGRREQREINGETEGIDLAAGFLFSEDGGRSWAFRTALAPSDDDPATTGILDLPDDTLVVYGAETLPALAVTVPESSPPWDIDYQPETGTLWTANQLAGIRRSDDGGRTWRRVVLPPDTTDFLSPDLGYVFPYYAAGIPISEFAGLNFQAFSVLADASGTIWAGTVGGLNRSDDGGVSWRRFDAGDGLTGNWIISIEEQPQPGLDNPAIWVASWPALSQGERFGAVVTRDRGETFEAVLLGERVYDFAFRGQAVYVAGENGLFVSEDGGTIWRTVRDFYDPTQPDRLTRPDVNVFSVATTPDALWVGTSDGLFKSTDGALTWRLFRAEVPLDPDELASVVPREAAPEVETYAYPNPFSPVADRLVRIRFEAAGEQEVRIRIFDFEMSLVRDLTGTFSSQGMREVPWDGTDERGARVANGTYFYAVEAGGDTRWGKILVLE